MATNSNSTPLPSTTRCLVLSKTNNTASEFPYDTTIKVRPIPTLADYQVLVRIVAAAFNHRELWQKKGLYPGIADESVMGCDGAGVVVASGRDPKDDMLGKRVFLTPMRGWKSDPSRPEGRLGVVGGGHFPNIGSMSEYVVVERDKLIDIPEHLSFEEASAWPCGGITAWRATFVKGALKPGQNVLITGCGGGVALTCLQLAVAAGANVYVTSGDQSKIDKATQQFGAKGGVNYKDESWPADLAELLKATVPEGEAPLLDLIIDQGGGDICEKTVRVLKIGAIISCFGMHTARGISFPMSLVLKNVELRGSTLGSEDELRTATKFISDHKIVPVVSEIIQGLDNSIQGFDLLQKGNHMGKIVVRIAPAGSIDEPKL